MHVAIFGTGYVGLVTGTCFAEMGNHVICVDVDPGKIERLRRGELPIFEPGLHELLEDNVRAKRLTFTTDPAEALARAEAAFICVGTPMSDDGQADLRYVESAARAIGRHAGRDVVVVTKSTVPVGTADKVRAWSEAELAKRGDPVRIDVGSNPEFLKEGSAVEDFMKPDRVVVGVASEGAAKVLHDLYSPFIRNGLRFYTMDIRSAEMTKYAANAFLATKISYINEIATICEAVGADVRQVRLGIGADSRIGLQFLHPGCGYGGSCFPKDVRALAHTAADHGVPSDLLTTVDAINRRQRTIIERKLRTWCTLTDRRLADLTVAVWGLAFKPNTDDVREAPALDLIRALHAAGVTLRCHDPKAAHEAKKALGDLDRVTYHDDEYEAAQADVLCLMTEWRPYRRPDWQLLRESLRARTIFDGRNQYDTAKAAESGITVFPIGLRMAVASGNRG
mgnify:CR=1 FL=1